jgi:arylsulfatase
MLMQIDSYTGELLDTIDELGIAENTVFIFTADNGPEALGYGETSMTVETAIHGSAGPWRSTLFTGYEGALRVPFVIRWPGQIAAGRVSDEIVHEMDLFPTLARIAGGTVPRDRPIDGIDQSDFILGKTTKSNREHVVTYVGNTLFAVKWRNMKVHYATAEGTHSVIVHEYTFPQVFDIKEDPKESYELWGNEGYAHAWVLQPVSKILAEFKESMKRYPNIQPGKDFGGYR